MASMSATTKGKNRVKKKNIKPGRKMMNTQLPTLDNIYNTCCIRTTLNILKDTSQPEHLLLAPCTQGGATEPLQTAQIQEQIVI